MMLQQLKEKLGDCKFPEKSLCENKSPYHHIKEKEFYVYDADDIQPVKIVYNGEYQLTVRNPSGAEICVVKTDRCLIKDANQKKCDCVLFDNSKVFFVEIKTSSSGTRKDKRNKAILQLGATIEYFESQGVILSSIEAAAIICFKNFSRVPSSINDTKSGNFTKKYKIMLEEKYIIEF
jgi:hypothetical protein